MAVEERALLLGQDAAVADADVPRHRLDDGVTALDVRIHPHAIGVGYPPAGDAVDVELVDEVAGAHPRDAGLDRGSSSTSCSASPPDQDDGSAHAAAARAALASHPA